MRQVHYAGRCSMKLIVSDMDGTLLNSQGQLSQENVEALLKAQKRGVEIAIASGRNYGNIMALCKKAGLQPHIISNNGSFAFTKEGERIYARSLDGCHVDHAVNWLSRRNYFFVLCCQNHIYTPRNAAELLDDDYGNAVNRSPDITEKIFQEGKEHFTTQDCVTFVDDFHALLKRDIVFGSISAITVDLDKLSAGREYFNNYQGLALAIAGKHIFEMIHPEASKGNALQILADHLQIPLTDVMAIGDNYNDLSMLQKVGISVAVDNAEEEVKKACRYISLSNDRHGVAHIIHQLLP